MKELDTIVLKNDVDEIKCGTKGTIVFDHGNGVFEVELFDNEHNTIAVKTISEKDLCE